MHSTATIASPQRDARLRGRRARLDRPETPPPPAAAPRVRVPVRGSSVLTGLDRSCRAELIGFASPIGRLSAILRITDDATGNTATSVVPVDFPRAIDGGTGTAEIMIPPSEVRARDVRAETAPLRLVPRLRGGTLLEQLLTAAPDGTSAHRQALVLTTALRAGALASRLLNDIEKDTGFDVGLDRHAIRHKEVSHDHTGHTRI